MTDDKRVNELRDKAIQAAIDDQRTAEIETFRPIFPFAVEGIKTLQLSHGGGLTAAMAFAGVRLNSGKPVPDEIGNSVVAFGAGLVLAILIWFFM